MTEITATAMPALLRDDDALDPIEARLRRNTRATIEALITAVYTPAPKPGA